MIKDLMLEAEFLNKHSIKSISISTTSKHSLDFLVLPRRVYKEIGISSFMINDEKKLIELLSYYDGLIDYFYIDTELKQQINLYQIALEIVKKTEIIAIKSNDITVESLDVLIRKKHKDNLLEKNVLVIGTGNIASKITTRLAERQANTFVKARTTDKAEKVVSALNLFLPSNSKNIKTLNDSNNIKFDIVIGAISSEFKEEKVIEQYISRNTLFIDVGINNFRSPYVNKLLERGNELIRLDTRIALPYQMIKQNEYTNDFFENIIGEKEINNISIVAGGIIGKEGSIIVDQIKYPTQVIGIADGSGGVKKDVSKQERKEINTIKQYISKSN